MPRLYAKPALAPAALLRHLTDRGLHVEDPAVALRALETIGYYRLLIYMRPLQEPGHPKRFVGGATFADVLALYDFDRKLRLLCLDAVERIEVALRAAIVSEVAVPHGSHFYLDPGHFDRVDSFVEFYQAARGAKYLGISHYRQTYSEPPSPPIWTVMEAVTYGALSRLFSNLKLVHRRAIARRFGFDEVILVSWFRSLNVLRNMCAHHNRLWNFQMLVDQPKIAKKLRAELVSTDRFYARALVMAALLEVIDPGSDWKDRFVAMLHAHPRVPIHAMGFPEDWSNRPFWRLA